MKNTKTKVATILIVLLALCLFLTGCATKVKTAEKSYELCTVEFDGNEMNYLVFGSGEKSFVVLPGLSIHTVMGLGEAVAKSYSRFTTEYTVYLFDRSAFLKEGYTIKDLADDTAKAMKALGIEGADIYGISQGGMIALSLAVYYPELCNRVIVASTLARTNDTFESVINNWIKLAEEKDEEGLLLSFIEDVYSENGVSAYKDVLLESNRGITDEEYERFIILANSCLNYDIYDDLDRVVSPVLVLGAEGDKVMTVNGPVEIGEKLGCSMCIYPKEYGHAVYDEAKDIKSRILEFLGVVEE